jgi:hypothetical protein
METERHRDTGDTESMTNQLDVVAGGLVGDADGEGVEEGLGLDSVAAAGNACCGVVWCGVV